MNIYKRQLLENFHKWQYTTIYTHIYGEITINRAIKYFVNVFV